MPLLLLASDALPVPAMFSGLPRCRDRTAPIDTPCTIATQVDAATARRRLGRKDHVWWLRGDRLTMIARPTTERWVMLCCSIQTGLVPVAGTGLAAVTVRIPRVREAILDVRPFPVANDTPEIVRGPDAASAPVQTAPPPERLISVAIASRWLGETRGLTIYLPPPGPAPLPMPQPLPVFYLADNLAAKFAPIMEAAVLAGRSPPAILVGIDAAKPLAGPCTGLACDRRGPEYKIDMSGGDTSAASPFGKHLRFVIDEVIPYIEDHYPASARREDRIIGGSSNGGHWALIAAALRPDLFGKVMALSASGRPAAAQAPALANTKLYGSAGLFEPVYLGNTLGAIAAAHDAGAQTRTYTVVAGHSQVAWEIMFADGAPWLLMNAPPPPPP